MNFIDDDTGLFRFMLQTYEIYLNTPSTDLEKTPLSQRFFRKRHIFQPSERIYATFSYYPIIFR